MRETPSLDSTLIVAAYGAILATAVAIYNGFLAWRKRRPNIKVTIRMGHLYWTADPSGPMLFLSASNPGDRAVTLNSLGFVFPDKSRFLPTNMESNVIFPHELGPDKGCTTWIGADEMAFILKERHFSAKVKLIGYYSDVVGRTHKSKLFEFDVDEDYA